MIFRSIVPVIIGSSIIAVTIAMAQTQKQSPMETALSYKLSAEMQGLLQCTSASIILNDRLLALQDENKKLRATIDEMNGMGMADKSGRAPR